MLDVFPRLLEGNCLHNEGGGFIQSSQNLFAFFVQHIVNASVEYVARTDFDGSVHGALVKEWRQFVQVSQDLRGVVVKLEKIGGLPIENFIFSRFSRRG
jgi:hypothetical protein